MNSEKIYGGGKHLALQSCLPFNGEMKPVWDAISFMGNVRQKFTQLNTINAAYSIGNTTLVLSKNRLESKFGSAAELSIEFGKTKTITVLFKGDRKEEFNLEERFDKALNTDLMILSLSSNPSRYMILGDTRKPGNKPSALQRERVVVVGNKSNDSRALNDVLGADFPDYAFAVTFKGERRLVIESLEANETIISVRLSDAKVEEKEIERIIEKNALMLYAHANSAKKAFAKSDKYDLYIAFNEIGEIDKRFFSEREKYFDVPCFTLALEVSEISKNQKQFTLAQGESKKGEKKKDPNKMEDIDRLKILLEGKNLPEDTKHILTESIKRAPKLFGNP